MATASKEYGVGAWRSAVAPCFEASNLRRTIRIALVVGIILTLINQLDLLISGDASALTPLKIALNFLVLFIVSNFGVIAGTRMARS